MTIFRGPGGTGSATSDSDTTEFQEFLVQSQAARDAALAAQVAAELAETNAETAETNAETAETNAETAATNAASSASAAASSASSASTSATNAASSASAASTSATNASASASAAAASASAALTSENNAETAETNAAASASAAASSASTATTQASNAAASASAALASETAAASSASSASSSASAASTSASNAATSASNAASSATSAANSASAAAASAASINPADIVHISGTETITGSKTFSSNPTLSGGTANGVAYLNGSKVLTTGSALTFDGTNLGIGTSSPSYKLDVRTASGDVEAQIKTDGASSAANLRLVGSIAGYNNIRSMTGATEEWKIGSGTAAGTMTFSTNNTERARIDSSGNLGLGVTPSAWGGVKAFDVGAYGSFWNSGAGVGVNANSYFNSGWKYKNTAAASMYQQDSGIHAWYVAPSGTAGNAISFTQAMTLDASGRLGVGTTSMSYSLQIGNGTADTRALFNSSTNYCIGVKNGANSIGGWIGTPSSGVLAFYQNSGTESARIDSSGNLLVGTTSGSKLLTVQGGSTGGVSVQAGFGGINATSFQIYHADAGGQSSAATVANIAKVASTNRSINAAGTINASGADYAEYMTKAGEFTVAKGDVVGIDSNGELTNVFSDAVSFCVKSTAPSYVGGDTWGAELEGDELEAARQKVDRIAFAGQVPVNVIGATAGQYIIPVEDNGAIAGQAVSNPTFEQYQIAVGKVIAIESDGRARIIVKVA